MRANQTKGDWGSADVYHFNKQLQSAFKLLEKSQIKSEDKELIKSFIEHLRAQNVGKARLAKYIFKLKVISGVLGVPFKDATRKDIERVMAKHQGRWTEQMHDDNSKCIKVQRIPVTNIRYGKKER